MLMMSHGGKHARHKEEMFVQNLFFCGKHSHGRP